jgi:hypothetical protein
VKVCLAVFCDFPLVAAILIFEGMGLDKWHGRHEYMFGIYLYRGMARFNTWKVFVWTFEDFKE